MAAAAVSSVRLGARFVKAVPIKGFNATYRLNYHAPTIFTRTFRNAAIRREEDVNEHGVNHIPGSTTSPGSAKAIPDPASHIEVTNYTADGKKSNIKMEVKDDAGPVSSGVADIEHKATPLTPELIGKLNPTMKKFTLEGKIAVVTG